MGTIIDDAPPPILLWIHSGGLDPATGKPNVSSMGKILTMLNVMHFSNPKSFENALIIVSGEETRKSGNWVQAEQIKAEILTYRPDLASKIRTYSLGTEETYNALVRDYPSAMDVLFVVDQPHAGRYMALFQLLNKRYYWRVATIEVPVGPNYGNAFTSAYLASYLALGWGQLVVRYASKGRWETPIIALSAAYYLVKALLMVGPKQLKLFYKDRRLNKATNDPAVLKQIAQIRAKLRPDLLGEVA